MVRNESCFVSHSLAKFSNAQLQLVRTHSSGTNTRRAALTIAIPGFLERRGRNCYLIRIPTAPAFRARLTTFNVARWRHNWVCAMAGLLAGA